VLSTMRWKRKNTASAGRLARQTPAIGDDERLGPIVASEGHDVDAGLAGFGGERLRRLAQLGPSLRQYLRIESGSAEEILVVIEDRRAQRLRHRVDLALLLADPREARREVPEPGLAGIDRRGLQVLDHVDERASHDLRRVGSAPRRHRGLDVHMDGLEVAEDVLDLDAGISGLEPIEPGAERRPVGRALIVSELKLGFGAARARGRDEKPRKRESGQCSGHVDPHPPRYPSAPRLCETDMTRP